MFPALRLWRDLACSACGIDGAAPTPCTECAVLIKIRDRKCGEKNTALSS